MDEIDGAEDDSQAARLEQAKLEFLDAAALAGLPIGRDFLEDIYEIVGSRDSGIPDASPQYFTEVLTKALLLATAAGNTVLADEDALDLAAVEKVERRTLRAVLEALRAARDARRGGVVTVDPDVLDRARRLEKLCGAVGLLDEDDLSLPVEALLASSANINMFQNQVSPKKFYHAAREAGYVVSRASIIGLHEALCRVDGLKAGPTLTTLAHALPLAPHGALLGDASVLRRALVAARIDTGGTGMCLNLLLTGDRDRDQALDAVFTSLGEKGFHTGPVAAYDDVLDPELTELRNELSRACGTTDAKAEAIVNALKTVDGLAVKRTLRLIVAAFQAGATLAPGQRDALRRAAEETQCETTSGVSACTTLKPLLTALTYADNKAIPLKKKAALIKALDEGNVHKQNVAFITYDVFIADLPACVADLIKAGKQAGLSFTPEDATTLYNEIKSRLKEGLNGCQATYVLQVLAARLRAGKCGGRALESVDGLAQACIAAGLRKDLNNVLKHLLEPLKHEDGPKPRKAAKAKIWDERRVVARRVADLLHAMGIHKNGVPFASYKAVQAAWRKKEDDREASSSDSEPEPEAKRPKCS